MAGIYIHIPFCKQKCHYCNFFSLASRNSKAAFLSALHQEIDLQAVQLHGLPVKTIYFGGGTPSLLEPYEIRQIISKIVRQYSVHPAVEITLEANPDDLSMEKLTCLQGAGINRLSIGIQSFAEPDLQYLNRAHTAAQAFNCIANAQKAGFVNISIDLIYGIPGASDKLWEQNISTAIKLGIPHISAYALTVEQGTALALLIKKGKMEKPSDERASDHFNLLVEKMEDAGYLHYEISNFAREGSFSKHNSGYWKGEYYLGLGPSAHSYNGQSRRWNCSSLTQYIEGINLQQPCFEEEYLTPGQKYNEFVMTSLRTQWGCDTECVKREFGPALYLHLMREAELQMKKANIRIEGGVLFLTTQGKFLADGIISELFFIDET